MEKLPVAGNVQGFVDSLRDGMWKLVPFHEWPYWKYVPYLLISSGLFFILLWFYRNFWRRSCGELPKDHKFT